MILMIILAFEYNNKNEYYILINYYIKIFINVIEINNL